MFVDLVVDILLRSGLDFDFVLKIGEIIYPLEIILLHSL